MVAFELLTTLAPIIFNQFRKIPDSYDLLPNNQNNPGTKKIP